MLGYIFIVILLIIFVFYSFGTIKDVTHKNRILIN